MKNKLLKVLTIVMITILGILVSSTSFAAAFEIFAGEVVLSGGRFCPQWIQGNGTMFCIWGHGAYKANMPRGYREGQTTGVYYGHGRGPAPWNGYKISMEYNEGAQLPMQNFQDAAYILAFGKYDMESAHAIWASTANFGAKESPRGFGLEAQAYNDFYHLIHSKNEIIEKDDDDDDNNQEEEPTYRLPGTSDIRIYINSAYNEKDIRSKVISKEKLVNEVTEALRVQWQERGIELTQEEVNATRAKVEQYYRQKYEEADVGVNGYPVPTKDDIISSSKGYHDRVVKEDHYEKKETYMSDVYGGIELLWYINYSPAFSYSTGFSEDEKAHIQSMMSEYFDEVLAFSGKMPSEEDIRRASSGNYDTKEQYISEVYTALRMRWSTQYATTFTAEQEAEIKQQLSDYYDANYGNRSANIVRYVSEVNILPEYSSTSRVYKLASGNTEVSYSLIDEIVQRDGMDLSGYSKTEFKNEMLQRVKAELGRTLREAEKRAVLEYSYSYYDDHIDEYKDPDEDDDDWDDDDDDWDDDDDDWDDDDDDWDDDDDDWDDDDDDWDDDDDYSPDFDSYYDEYYDNDDTYYDDRVEYKTPTMDDVDRVAREEYYYYDEDYGKEIWEEGLEKDEFTERVFDLICIEWWDNLNVELTYNEQDDLRYIIEEYFDKYVRPGKTGGKYTQTNKETPSMDEINQAVKDGNYNKDKGKDQFVSDVKNDVINKWETEHGTKLDDEQKDELTKDIENYYNEYTSQDKDYSQGRRDKYLDLVKDNTDASKLKVRVERSNKTFVAGPFNVVYPNGNYGGVNKWSWIKNVKIYDQDGKEIGNVLNGSIEIIDKDGNLIYDTDKDGNNLNVPQNGKDFYIRFHSDTTVDISITIDFGYLESIQAEAYRYEGHFVNWYWVRQDVGEHTYTCDHDDSSHTVHCCNKYVWVLKRKSSASSQLLMKAVSATPVYKEVSYTLLDRPQYRPNRTDRNEPPRLDMTMDIEGRVFLDRDGGKTNTGNNEYDVGEELANIDVWLYNKTDNNKLIGVTITDQTGQYKFTRLNAMKEYYVQFTYNGMLYTNVVYKENGDNGSKATEEAQNHNTNRTDFNNLFKEIGSYPANYTTKDCITGETIKNKVYKQDELVELYKEVAKAMEEKGRYQSNTTGIGMSEADVKKAAYQEVINKNGSVDEIKEKVQFIADTRINAYTVTNYSRHTAFRIDNIGETMGQQKYENLYYEQKYVNLGIKARPTFDLALYKDVMKAEVKMNGKSETYIYDKRTSNGNDFSIGVSESDYLNGIRENYIKSKAYDNEDKRRELETDTYDLNMRSEEVANGQSSNYNLDVTGKVNKNYELNNDYDNLKLDGTNKTDRLEIDVTYKIAIRNQSGIVGAVTEIVDYFDPNYSFVRAYEGDKNGNETGKVTKYDTSMYANTAYENNSAYKTIYLRPDQENRLHNDNKEQYIYVVLRLLGPNNDAGTLLSEKLLNNNVLSVTNLAEINGYKTYDEKSGSATPGLIDIDSTPGNLDLRSVSEFTADEIKKMEDTYEDDTSKAPALIYKLLESRTIEGTVFEDATGKDNKVYTGEERKGNGQFDEGEKGIDGVIVQLVEIKNDEMFVRSTTKTHNGGWYGFVGFLPGNYTIRYIYGADDDTAMTTNSKWIKGLNDTSYNGQDYQSTIFGVKQNPELNEHTYKTDADLVNRYKINYDNKNAEESAVNPNANTLIKKYNDTANYYWYTQDDKLSDAKDDEYRRQQVIWYARNEYVAKELTYPTTAVTNHKAEVFNSYLSEQPAHISQSLNRELVNELERRAYRFAYTAEMPIEVEYAVQTIPGTGTGYEHKITNVDFGVVERPRAKVELTKNVEHIKVTTTDGIVLFDTNKQVENLAWPVKKDRYKEKPPIQIIMDEELISGSTVEITYKITVTNKGELGESATDGENGTATTTMKRILDYVDNALNFNEEDNLDANGKALWKVVTVDDMQNETNATFINNSPGANNLKLIDLSTQQTLLQTTPENPLSKALAVGETAESTLTLRKVLSAESSTDQLTYNNTMETIEIDNEVGRYDHESIPGNQDPEKDPQEDDTFKSEIITILPPFGAKSYYVITAVAIGALAVLGLGVFVIKKYVLGKKE